MANDTPRSTVRAIETRYAGHRFRSRLEARWAVFFDALRIEWEYEPQGFVIGDGTGATRNYLPDFRLTATGTWVEVKGDPQELDWGLIGSAVYHAGPHLPDAHDAERDSVAGVLVLGNIPTPGKRWGHWLVQGDQHAAHADTVEFIAWPKDYGSILRAPIFDDHAVLAPSLDTKWGPAEHHGVALGGQHIPARDLYFAEYADRQGALVTAAYHAARTARFEWGETPRVTAPRIPAPRITPPRLG